MREPALVEIPWARRVWALPFLCALAHSERYAKECAKRHKPFIERAGQLLVLVRRWCPRREIVAVADGGYVSLKLLDRCRKLREPIMRSPAGTAASSASWRCSAGRQSGTARGCLPCPCVGS